MPQLTVSCKKKPKNLTAYPVDGAIYKRVGIINHLKCGCWWPHQSPA